MTHLISLVVALSVILSVTAAPAIPSENDVYPPPMLISVSNLPKPEIQKPPKNFSWGSSPVPAVDDNAERNRPVFDWNNLESQGGELAKLDRSDFDDSWPTQLACEVYISGAGMKYLSLNGGVRWESEGRQGPVFRWSHQLGSSELLFLERIKVQGNAVSLYAGGAVAITSSTNNTDFLHDSHGALTFHFVPVGSKYRIYYSKNGAPYGPPAHLEGEVDTRFDVQIVSRPDSISAFESSYGPATIFNTTTQFATTVCSHCSRTRDYLGPYGDSYELEVLGGQPKAFLQPPIPGIGDTTRNASIQFGKLVTHFRYRNESLTLPRYRATLVALTLKEIHASILWTATMSYQHRSFTRVVAGLSQVWHIMEYIATKTYPGDLFSPENCRPISEHLNTLGVSADGKRSSLRDNDVDYRWVPRLRWM